MFDFEKFGSQSTSNPTKPEEQKKGSTFNFDSFGSIPETTTPTSPSNGGVNVSGTNQIPSEDTEPGFARKAFDLFTSSEQGFGESIGQAINTQLYAKEAEENNARYMKAGNDMLALAKKTLDPIKKETYLNQSQKYFDQAGRGIQDIIGGDIKTTKQVLGEAAGTALDIATMGTYGAAAKTAISGVKMAKPAMQGIPTIVSKLSSEGIKEAGKKVGIGTGIGYGYDVSFNLQNQEHTDGVSILTPGFATLVGVGLPSLGFAYGAVKEVVKGKPLETVVKVGMEKGVKPSVAGKQTLGKIDEYHQKAADAIKSIVNYKDNLKFVDPITGDEIVGELPKTLEQFGAAIEQTKKAIFSEYDALAKATGKQGNVVTFDSLLPELEKAANDTVLNLKDPHAAAYAADMAEKFKQLQQLTPEQAQQYITQMNADLQSFYRNPTYGTSSKVGIDVLIVNNMRKALDAVIESATGKEYQKLKSMYGSLKSIEKDVNHRAVVDARKSNATLVDYSNIFTYGDIAKGLISMDPATVAKGTLGKGLQMFYKWRNDPNVLIKEMFEKGEKAIKNNVPSKPPIQIKSNKGFIDTMFPQPGKESPSVVKQTILDKMKSMPAGMSIKDVSGGKAGYENPIQEAKNFKTKEEFIAAFDRYKGGENKGETKIPHTYLSLKDIYPGEHDNWFDVAKMKGSRERIDKMRAEFDPKKLDPILIRKYPKSNGFAVEDGHHRMQALIEASLMQGKDYTSKIPVYFDRDTLEKIWKVSNGDTSNETLSILKKELQSKGGVEKVSTVIAPKEVYKTGPLTTKLLKKLEGRSTVSKTFISDLTNAPDLKQTEKDVIRQVLESEGDKINVADFGKKVESELLPLKLKSSDIYYKDSSGIKMRKRENGADVLPARYEGISLPDELRGDVKSYAEHIYESPIKTSAGDIHFSGSTKSYFGHTRVEDLPDNKTRRVTEVQSDLYQKGRLEGEKINPSEELMEMELDHAAGKVSTKDFRAAEDRFYGNRNKELSKLEQYNNPTAHFRMVREEIKKAADDGVEKLQFPTGETGMKIEGLGSDSTDFYWGTSENFGNHITKNDFKLVKVGNKITGHGGDWIVTDVLVDGKFKAVPKEFVDRQFKGDFSKVPPAVKESFDISSKIDTNNPIYKFYEKELGRYLKNNFDAKLVTDKQGVSWIEVTIKPEHKGPVTAFGASNLAGMTTGLTTILGLGVAANMNPKTVTIERKKERTVLDKPFITERRDGAATSKSEDLLSELLDKYTIKKPIANNTKTKTIIDGIDIAPYATAKEHEQSVKNEMLGMQKLKTAQDINNEIERVSKAQGKESEMSGTGETILRIVNHYNISLPLFMSILKVDSSLGTSNKSKNNPGNITNDDTGKKTDFDTIEEGLVAAARYLASNRN